MFVTTGPQTNTGLLIHVQLSLDKLDKVLNIRPAVDGASAVVRVQAGKRLCALYDIHPCYLHL